MKKILGLIIIGCAHGVMGGVLDSYTVPTHPDLYLQLGNGFNPAKKENPYLSKKCIQYNENNIKENKGTDFSYRANFFFDSKNVKDFFEAKYSGEFKGSIEFIDFSAKNYFHYKKEIKIEDKEIVLAIDAMENGANKELIDYELKPEFRKLLKRNQRKFVRKCGTHLFVKANKEISFKALIRFKMSSKEFKEFMNAKFEGNLGDSAGLFDFSMSLELKKAFEKKIRANSYRIEIESKGLLASSEIQNLINPNIDLSLTGDKLISDFINKTQESIAKAVKDSHSNGKVVNYLALPYQGLDQEFNTLNSVEKGILRRNIGVLRHNNLIIEDIAKINPAINSQELNEYLKAVEMRALDINEEIKERRHECLVKDIESSCHFKAEKEFALKSTIGAIDEINLKFRCQYDTRGVLSSYSLYMNTDLFNPGLFQSVRFYFNGKETLIDPREEYSNGLYDVLWNRRMRSSSLGFILSSNQFVTTIGQSLSKIQYEIIKNQLEKKFIKVGFEYENYITGEDEIKKTYIKVNNNFCNYKQQEK